MNKRSSKSWKHSAARASWLACLTLCFWAGMVSADAVQGEAITESKLKNLLPDPGMERLTGDIAKDAWSYYSADHYVVDKETVHGGKQSLRLNATDKTKGYGVYSGGPASEGPIDVVEFGAWIKTNPPLGEGNWVRVYAQIYLKGGALVENTAVLKGASADWRFIGARVPLGGKVIDRVLLYLIAENYAGTVWIDDVCLGYGEAPLKKGANLIPDAGCEDVSKWRPYGEGGFIRDDAVMHSGKSSMTLKAGEPLRLYGARCVVKPEGPAVALLVGGWCRSSRTGGRVSLTADVHYKDGSVLPGLAVLFPANEAGWLNQEKELLINPGEIDYIALSAELLYAETGQVWFDDVYLQLLTR